MHTFTVYSISNRDGAEVRENGWKMSDSSAAFRKAATRADQLALMGYDAIVRRGKRGTICYRSTRLA